jgi:uncharacterized protein (TIGR03437 family)
MKLRSLATGGTFALLRLASLFFILLAASCWLVLPSHSVPALPSAKLQPADAAHRLRVNEAFGKVPLSFEINQGQAATSVSFLARPAAGGLYLYPHEAVFEFARQTQPPALLRLKLKHANPAPLLVGEAELPGKHHYLLGQEVVQWRRNIPTYARVRYQQVYPGIDLVWYGTQTQVEYDFIIAPGAEPRAIRLAWEGVERVRLDDNGDLLLQTPAGELRQSKPMVYQTVAGVRRPIAGAYQLTANHELSFAIGAYDRSQPLVIDPVLNYLANVQPAQQLAVDSAGNAYLARSLEINGAAAFGLTKLNAAGTAVLYQTILGNLGLTSAADLAVDAAGSAHLLCNVVSLTFPGVEQIDLEGLQKGTDGAANWAASGRGLASTILKIIPDPSTPQRLFAQGDWVNGRVIYHSEDGGQSWRLISENLKEATLLTVLPGNPVTLLARTPTQLMSSRDLGASWQETALRQPNLVALEFEPGNPAVLYATAHNVLQKSSDGGQTWSPGQSGLPAEFVPLQLAPDPTTLGQVYLLLLVNAASGSETQLYRSTNAGADWQLALKLPDRPMLTIAVAAQNGTLYVGTSRGLFKSADGGRTVQPAGLAEVSVRALALDPVDPATLYASTPTRCCDSSPFGQIQLGGVHKTADGGATWVHLNNSFQNKLVYALTLDPFAPATVYAAVLTSGFEGVYVLKLDPQGAQPVYSVAVADGRGAALALDGAGDVYVVGVGRPRQSQFFAPAEAGKVSFVVKLNGQQQAVAYSSAWPGQARAVAVDAAGRVALTGQIGNTQPLNARNGFQTQLGGRGDAYVLLLDPRQTGEAALLYATYLGGQENDEGHAIGWDAQGGIYVAGATESSDFPVTPATRLSQSGSSFLARLNPAQSAAASLSWSARLRNSFSAMGVAANGVTYLAGSTDGSLPVTPGAWQSTFAGGNCPIVRCTCELVFGFCPARCGFITIPNPCPDAYLLSVASNGTALLYATYVGSAASRSEGVTDLALDTAGNVYLAGLGGLPATAGALQETGSQGFIAKFTLPVRNTAANVLSAAHYAGPELARESLAVAFLEAAGVGVEKLGVSVRDSAGVERAAQVLFAGAGQVNFQIPPGSQNGPAAVFVTSNAATIASGSVQLVDVAPGIFTANASGRGLPAAVALRVKADGTSAYENILRFDAQGRPVPVPIDLGPEAGHASDQVLLVLFGVGWRHRSAETHVKVSVGGVDAPVLYAGVQPTLTGLDQINARLPRSLAGRSDVEVVVMVDGKTANPVRVTIK